ncbi:ribonuclease domain-containing protein [Micrococcaceae bacterium Sec5.7]
MRRPVTVAVLLIGLVALALLVSNNALFPGMGSPTAAETSAVSPGPSAVRSGAPAVAPSPSTLATVKESALPAEGRETLVLISRGGPYPYRAGDGTFGNFEQILPQKQEGYYKEYTVITPGEPDRGARRIVAGDAGEKYYTQDHYDSFKFIAEGK